MRAATCGSLHPDGMVCTLPVGHDGPHEAQGQFASYAQWDSCTASGVPQLCKHRVCLTGCQYGFAEGFDLGVTDG